MWDEVKPISVEITQINDDLSEIVYDFYSHDYEVVKLSSAIHKKDGKLLFSYDKFGSKFNSYKNAKYFVSRINKNTTQKLIEYYENRNLYLEFFI